MQFLHFWIFPLISAGTWLGMLLAMLITWEVEGHPHYASFNAGQRIAYISDIGAQGLKPLFIAGCCVTTVALDISFLSERWARHKGILARNLSVTEKVLSSLSIVAAIAGTCGLILLSIFDTLHYPHLHDGFLVLFLAGYIISAIFICWEYQRLGIHFRRHRVLRASFWIKLFFIFVEVGLAIAFGVTEDRGQYNASAVLEWTIALIFTFYVLTFFMDLLPAVRRSHSQRAPPTEAEMGMADSSAAQNGYYGEMHRSTDSGYGLTHNTYANGQASNSTASSGANQTRPVASQNF